MYKGTSVLFKTVPSSLMVQASWVGHQSVTAYHVHNMAGPLVNKGNGKYSCMPMSYNHSTALPPDTAVAGAARVPALHCRLCTNCSDR
jgi:hypothetical protein